MRLFSNARKSIKEFMTDREKLLRIFYCVLVGLYAILYLVFKPETHLLSTVITSLLVPVIVFPFYYRIINYVFIKNWFYLIYIVVTTFVFLFTITIFGGQFEYKIGSYETAHFLCSMIFGYLIAAIVSLPFKLIHYIVFDVGEFYYSDTFLPHLEKTAFPDRIQLQNVKKAETFKYDTMNETQLNAELNLAVKEDRFEDAEKIRKILQVKFK